MLVLKTLGASVKTLGASVTCKTWAASVKTLGASVKTKGASEYVRCYTLSACNCAHTFTGKNILLLKHLSYHYTFYTKRFLTLFIDKLTWSKATCLSKLEHVFFYDKVILEINYKYNLSTLLQNHLWKKKKFPFKYIFFTFLLSIFSIKIHIFTFLLSLYFCNFIKKGGKN